MSLERCLRNIVLTVLRFARDKNSSKMGELRFSLLLGEKGAVSEGRIVALKSPMTTVSQAAGIGSRELVKSL